MRQRIAGLNRSLARCIPTDSEWRFVPFSLHACLLPPASILSEFNAHLNALRDLLDAGRFRRLRERLHYTLLTALITEEHYERFPGIEAGTSFGLHTSRVYFDAACLNWDEGNERIIGVRLAPGFDADEAALQAYVREMFARFRQRMDEVLTMLRRRRTLGELLLAPSRQKLSSQAQSLRTSASSPALELDCFTCSPGRSGPGVLL